MRRPGHLALLATFALTTGAGAFLSGHVLHAARTLNAVEPAQSAVQSAVSAPVPPPAEDPQKDEGTPILNDAVVRNCGLCHTPDDKKRMSRLSYRRTTPEGWEETIKRMVSLNSLSVSPEDAREVLRYLSNTLGLAPDEAKPAAFELERRLVDAQYDDKQTEETCNRCHSIGRVMLQRRTKQEWTLLVAMHRGYYPWTDFQAFRRPASTPLEPGPDGAPPDRRQPFERAIDQLATAYPLRTAAWSAWSANVRPPRLQGRWALSGYQPGRGPVYGEVQIAPAGSAGDEFTTEIHFTYAQTGKSVTRTGKSIVYTGYQWRGRSLETGVAESALREVMFVDRDWTRMSGRWFSGAYHETGIDMTLRRIGGDPIVLGAWPMALRTGAGAQAVRIFGARFPDAVSARDIDLGEGVTVTRVASATPSEIQLDVDVAAGARSGGRDLFVAGASSAAAVAVYDRIDLIKVTPQAGMARVGGAKLPRGYQQFEATAYTNGADGKPATADDVSLGLVDATWSIEEFAATFADDDKDFVGTIDQTGLFTPNDDGPNPKRHNQANNVGDVWVVATLKADPKTGLPNTIRGRAHLLVTVPLYLVFDQPGVSP